MPRFEPDLFCYLLVLERRFGPSVCRLFEGYVLLTRTDLPSRLPWGSWDSAFLQFSFSYNEEE